MFKVYNATIYFMRNLLTLDIWKRSHILTLKIYKITKNFPKEEMFRLSSQMRRSASSIPTNIAEGCGRNTNPQFAHFLQISTGSCSEIQYQLILSKELSYISEEVFNELNSEAIEIRKMIFHYASKL